MNAHRPAGADKAASAELTRLIVELHQRGLSFDQIVNRLWRDFGITLSRSAVWQRWKRGTQGPQETISGTEVQ